MCIYIYTNIEYICILYILYIYIVYYIYIVRRYIIRNKILLYTYVVVVQSPSHVQLFEIPRTTPCQTPLSFSVFWGLLRFMSIELVMLSNHLILCHPFSFCLQSFSALGSFPMNLHIALSAKVLEIQL